MSVKGFQKGQSGNPNGRPKKKDTDSPLRSTYNKLKAIESSAIEYLSKVTKGEFGKDEFVDKERLNVCKWVVDSTVKFRKAIVEDENQLRNGANPDDELPKELEQPKERIKLLDLSKFDKN